LNLDPAAIAREADALVELDPVVGERAADFVLSGGEDHALLATFPPGPLPAGFRPLGTVLALDDPRLRQPATPDALIGAEPHSRLGGWDPYADWDGHAG
ncbi:MAG: thiamine-phosphate kinase, partial [Herbiconiux sp.]|nr:thiamine-phosphate kinase [Herbiconiux sp.]